MRGLRISEDGRLRGKFTTDITIENEMRMGDWYDCGGLTDLRVLFRGLQTAAYTIVAQLRPPTAAFR